MGRVVADVEWFGYDTFLCRTHRAPWGKLRSDLRCARQKSKKATGVRFKSGLGGDCDFHGRPLLSVTWRVYCLWTEQLNEFVLFLACSLLSFWKRFFGQLSTVAKTYTTILKSASVKWHEKSVAYLGRHDLACLLSILTHFQKLFSSAPVLNWARSHDGQTTSGLCVGDCDWPIDYGRGLLLRLNLAFVVAPRERGQDSLQQVKNLMQLYTNIPPFVQKFE